MFTLNPFGHLPFNPDNLLDRKRLYDRPVGFTFDQILKLYWTVKSFRVSIRIISFNEISAFETFMGAGGLIGSINASITALGLVDLSIGRQQPIELDGQTKIYSRYQKTIRNKPTYSAHFDGFNINNYINTNPADFEKDNSKKSNPLVSLNLKPNEGTLCSAGPVHKIIKGGSYLSIDFSDILNYKRLWWPKIYFFARSSNLAFTFAPPGEANVIVRGLINFMGAGIPVYGYSESFTAIPTQLVVAFGSIDIGKRCCDRFYWDGFDEERSLDKEKNCSKDCEDVFLKEKPKEENIILGNRN